MSKPNSQRHPMLKCHSNPSLASTVSNEHTTRDAFYFDQAPNTEPKTVFHHLGMAIETSVMELSADCGPHYDACDMINHHRIYAIDELSEVSGRSDAVQAHERQQLEMVQLIVSQQEQQARNRRPVTRRGQKFQARQLTPPPPLPSSVFHSKELAVSMRTPSSPADSPHYGYSSDARGSSGGSSCSAERPSMHKCRIVIPTLHTDGDEHRTKFYDAYIFDLDLASGSARTGATTAEPTLSRRTSAQPSNSYRPAVRANGHSRNTSTYRATDEDSAGVFQPKSSNTSKRLTRSQAVPALPKKSSCCGCFGMGSSSNGGGGGGNAGKSRNDPSERKYLL